MKLLHIATVSVSLHEAPPGLQLTKPPPVFEANACAQPTLAMTIESNPKPKSATHEKLRLKPPTILRLPFSSPMGEEVLSPTSPNSRTPPQDRREKFAVAMGQEKATPRQRGLALETATKGDVGRLGGEAAKPKKVPGLNVVTTFPTRKASAQTTGDDDSRQYPPRGSSRPGNTAWKGDASNGQQTRHRYQPSVNSLTSAGPKGRLGDLRRADSKVSTLSPSDRAVVIGISLPQNEASDVPISAVSPVRERDRKLGSQLARDRRPSITPSIVITPAKDIEPWSAEAEDDKASPPRPRARSRSSVYSQGPGLSNIIDSSVVPPVPALPPESKQHNMWIKTGKEPSERVMSTCTIFDEEEDPVMGARGRPGSGQSQNRILHCSSMDTIATRPRSQGWWNNIMSPFWPKSPMSFKTPPLPSPKNGSPQGDDRNTLIEEDDVSVLNEKAGDLESKHTSWTDSPIEEEHEKPALTFDEILPGTTRSITALQPDTAVPDSSIIPSRFEGFGAAAEYFEACLYEEHSSTPYFACQNHSCLPRDFEANGVHQDDLKMSSMRGVGLEEANPSMSNAEGSRAIDALQAPTNRFSSALHEAVSPEPRQRPTSDATVIEDLDETPDVQEAYAASVVKAPEPIPMAQPAAIREEIEPEEPVAPIKQTYRTPPPPPPPPADSPVREFRPATPAKRYIAVMPPEPSPPKAYEEPITPGPQTQAPKDALPLRNLRDNTPAQDTSIVNHNYYGRGFRQSGEQTSMADFFPPPKKGKQYPRGGETSEEQERGIQEEKKGGKGEEKKNKSTFKESKPSMLSKLGNCCCHRRKDNGDKDSKMSRKKKRLLWLLAAGLIWMIILIVVLAMTLHRKGDTMAVQSQWLNITGYPPIPTGVSTIAQPNAVDEVSGCVVPDTLWSCALPKEQQQVIAPNAPDQPNFRVEIRFQNGTNATSSINSTTNSKRSERVAKPASTGSFIRRRLLELRNALPSSLYIASPSPPNPEDQSFLGNTTDGNHAPYDGEYTPFFMTFDPPAPLPSSSRLLKRATTSISSTAPSTADPFPNLATVIPSASANPNGTASPANLYPFPAAQPLRLFDRGLASEHYGFYTYFDRSIFLKSTGLFNGSYTSVPGDGDGGALENSAKVRCTWAQTRFLVQIWTNKGSPYPLLSGNGTLVPQSGQNATSLANSSANDLSRPGSFPYPVTILLDRHGGDIKTKEIYCYGLDDSEKPTSTKKVALEDRAFKGTLVNPAQGPFASVKVDLKDGGPGGIDGGSGGCRCAWQNWK